MSGLKKVFVATGITSSLFTSLIPFLRYSAKEVHGVVRIAHDSDKRKHQNFLKSEGINLINLIDTQLSGNPADALSHTIQRFFADKNEAELQDWRILWFSTHDDRETLAACARIAPTLAIGSGAMVDFYLGNIPKSNDYIDSKLRMALTPNVTTLCCGFYLEDDPNVPLTPSGLHRDTTLVLLGQQSQTDPKWWKKAYYMTPKTFACEAIVRWIANPQNKLGKWYHVGTAQVYSRADIASALGTKLPEGVELDSNAPGAYAQYQNIFVQDFGIKCDHNNIVQSLAGVKEWGRRNAGVNQ